MQLYEIVQLVLFLVLLVVLTKPLGKYLYKVLNYQEKTFLDPLLKPLEKLTYRLCNIQPNRSHNWKEYLFAVFAFSFASFIFTYILLALQPYLPLNPASVKGLSADLNFNTSISFLTNTDWQSYKGESTMSYFSQMIPLTLQNFVSAAVGIGVAAALSRGIAQHASRSLGNFWVDLVRVTYYLLLPLAFCAAIFFVSQGVPQNFSKYTQAQTIESQKQQTIVQGPIASQEAIKLVGTNGGGYTNANSAHPYENPTPLSNFLQILLILLIPAAQTYYFGKEIGNQRHGWCIFIAMMVVFVAGFFVCQIFEAKGTPTLNSLNLVGGNLEGKEVRNGILGSSLFATVTTTASCGAVNSMHDSFTPIGGMITMLNIQLGEVIWGGVGAGLYNMLLFVILTVFTAGLIIGRTPEYLGNRIDAFDIKVAVFALLPYMLGILGFTAWACISTWGTGARGNLGPHGFSEILYAFSSATGNNGSAFAGLAANTPIWNITLALGMLIGRFLVITPILALAGSFVMKKHLPLGPGSFPVFGSTFIVLLISVIILIGALSFLPALVMGPFIEQFFMNASKLF